MIGAKRNRSVEARHHSTNFTDLGSALLIPILVIVILRSDYTMIKIDQSKSSEVFVFGEYMSPSDITVNDTSLMDIIIQRQDTHSVY